MCLCQMSMDANVFGRVALRLPRQLLHGASSEAAAGKTILVAHPTAESTTVNASGVNTIGSSVAMKRPITSLDEVPITGLQWRQSSVS